MRYLIKVIVIIISFVFSINVLAQKTINFSIDDFKNAKHIEGSQVNRAELSNPIAIVQADTFLIILNKDVPVFFDVLSIKTGKILASFGNRGKGPGELITPFSMYYNQQKEEVVVYDLTTKNIFHYSLPRILAKSKEIVNRQIKVGGCYPVRIYEGETGYIAAIMGSKDANCFAEISEVGKLNHYFGSYPDIKEPYNGIIAHSLFSVYAGVKKNYAVNAYGHWDRIDIYKDQGCSLILNGPDYEKYDVVVENNNAVQTSNNDYAYATPILGDDCFFLSYSGEGYYNYTGANYLFKIAYDGMLISKYELDHTIKPMSVAVDWSGNCVYAVVETPEPVIMRFNL